MVVCDVVDEAALADKTPVDLHVGRQRDHQGSASYSGQQEREACRLLSETYLNLGVNKLHNL